MDGVFPPGGNVAPAHWQDCGKGTPCVVGVLRRFQSTPGAERCCTGATNCRCSSLGTAATRWPGGTMSVKQSEFVSYSIRTAVAVALGTVAMMASAPPVLAQAAGPSPAAGAAPVLEEVTVTGSR